jgi:hypothetical protein
MKRRLIATLAIVLMLVATLSLPAVADEKSTTASVSVNEVISITLVGGSISFGSVIPPVTEQGATGQVDGSPAISVNVASETNVNVDIGIKGAILTSSLALTNWKYSITFGAVTKTSIPPAYGTAVYTNALPGSNNAFYHWITVPGSTPSGNHTITVSYKAVKTGTIL